ncbi:B- and T-lymphocyte attenuator isoform X2 [Nothobranchius furzeri]|uniref:Transcript variant X2 n=1 Tax=Nothobranchius furzeri TaxID=105023 RepID=A0A9D3BP39_NOTFU|nr:B- and T-lymphocyte attenuator isoform X2 [Nothobranchius furzeri]KAF7214705.1 transcript variant X2 [Nothobranchius furzeri]
MSVGCKGTTLMIFIMGPESCRNILKLFILAELILAVNADRDECDVEMKVRRNTVYEASVEGELRIKCPVVFCNKSPPAVTWIKWEKTFVPVTISDRVQLEWTTNQQEGTSYLVFHNVLRSDAGTYRCGSGGSVSHNIYLIVNDGKVNDTSTERAKTTNPGTKDNFMMCMYSAAGIGAFIVMVIIVSVVSMRGCKGKSKKEPEKESQYIELPAVEWPTEHLSGREPSPRGSPNPPPSHRSNEKKTPRQPEEATSGDNEHLYGQTKKIKNSKGKAAPPQEPSSVVYASLNHQLPPRTGARAQIPVEQTEYAAIRLG